MMRFCRQVDSVAAGRMTAILSTKRKRRKRRMSRRTSETRILAALLALLITLTMTGSAFAAKQVRVSSLKFKDKSVVLTYRKGIVSGYYSVPVTVKPSNASNKTLKWTSSNKKVATVDDQGRITPVKAGKCVITATATDGSGKKAKCNVKVQAAKPNSKKKVEDLRILSYQKVLSIENGKKENVTLPVYLLPLDAGNISLAWSTSDKKVATVSSSGKVTAQGAGTCEITAAAKDGSGKTSTCTIKVVEIAPSSGNMLILDADALTLQRGTSYTLTWHLTEKPTEKYGFSFGSDNADVAYIVEGTQAFDPDTLEGSCTLYAVDRGTCSITLSYVSTVTETCNIAITVTE